MRSPHHNTEEEEVTLKEKLRYRFDNLMSKGTGIKVLMLLGISLVIIVIMGVILTQLRHNPVDQYPRGIWDALVNTFDPGTISGYEDDLGHPSLVILFIATIFGMLFTATLIGIVNNGLEGYMDELSNGTSAILEKDHTIILGFNHITYAILEQLVEANANEHVRQKVVVMDDKTDKPDMDRRIHRHLEEIDHNRREAYRATNAERAAHQAGKAARFEKYTRHTKVITRKGHIYSPKDLAMCHITDCRSIIVNGSDDSETIRAIIACTSALKEAFGEQENGSSPYIVAVIHDRDNMDTARLAGGAYLEVICYEDIMSRVMANSSRRPGLSFVFTELFNYLGSEVYSIRKEDIDFSGAKLTKSPEDLGLYELNQYLDHAIVIGGTDHRLPNAVETGRLKDNKWEDVPTCVIPTMNDAAEEERKLKDVNQLYIIAEDNLAGPSDKYHTHPLLTSTPAYTTTPGRPESPHHADLVIGTSSLLLPILEELDGFLRSGAKIFVFDHEENLDRFWKNADFQERLSRIHGIKVTPVAVDIDDYNSLYAELKEAKASNHPEYLEDYADARSVIILADECAGNPDDDQEERHQAADDATMARLLFMRKIRDDVYPDLSITCEINKDENRNLAADSGSEDYIVGSTLTAMIITQIAQTRELHRIFHELLDKEGSEVYMRRAYKCLTPDAERDASTERVMKDHFAKVMDLPTVAATLAQKNEVFIGFRLWEGDHFEMPILNPLMTDAEGKPRFLKHLQDGKLVNRPFNGKDFIITIATKSDEGTIDID